MSRIIMAVALVLILYKKVAIAAWVLGIALVLSVFIGFSGEGE